MEFVFVCLHLENGFIPSHYFPGTGVLHSATDDIIESLVCPPPPSDPPIISDEMISGLIVPAPGWSN